MYECSCWDIFLVTAGFAVMSYAIFMYFKLSKSMQAVKEQIDKLSIVLFRLYIVLMVFFLIGYAVFDVLMIYAIDYGYIQLISYIFFFGAIFVFIGIFVQTRLTDCIFKSNSQMVFTLVNAVEARDANLKGHSVHVMGVSLLIYDSMDKSKVSAINRQKFQYACILHDIGKMGIPEHILNKPSKLDDAEWELMRQHPKIGIDILSSIKGLDEIRNWILYHHERYDGNGYYKLKGREIPFASRIICVADSYSAIVMRRSYKKETNHEKALEIMKECVGTQFDPYVFSVFESIPKEKLSELFKESIVDKG